MSERTDGLVSMAVAAVVWGSIPVVIKRAPASAAMLAALRMGFGAAFLGAYLAVTRRSFRLGGSARLVAALGVVLGVHWLLFFQSIKMLPGATAVLVNYVFPVLVALAAPAALGEPRGRLTLPLAVVAFAGIAVILAPGLRSGALAGGGVALVSAAGVALLMLLARRAAVRLPGVVIAFWQQAVGCLVVLPFAAASGGSVPWRWGALLGLVHTALTSVLFFRSLSRVRAPEAGIVMYAEPVSAVGFAWLLLGVAPGPSGLAGAALVLGAGAVLVAAGPTPDGATDDARSGPP